MNDEAPWRWTRRFGVNLTISVALFAAWGALAPHIPTLAHTSPMATGAFMASFYATAQGLANCSAANARRMWNAGERLAAAFFASIFIGFALLSMLGLHAAWAFAQANAGDAPLPNDALMHNLFWFVAFSEPLLNFGVEALKTQHKAQQRQEERDDLDAAAEREARRGRFDAHARPFHAVAAAVAANVVTTSPAGPAAAAPGLERQFPRAVAPLESDRDAGAEAHAARGWLGPRDEDRWRRVVEAHELGMSAVEIIRDLQVPSTTTYRWLALIRSGVKSPM